MALLNKELFLKLAKQEHIESKKDLAKEINISRQHLYRLLKGENIGLNSMIKIAKRFPEYSEELFFLDHCNKKETTQILL